MFATSRFYVRDGALIGDLRDAVQPMLWRMELARVHAVAFRVVENGGVWELGIEGAKGEFTPVAAYKSADAANNAFARLSRALRTQGGLKRLMGLIGFLIVLAIFAFTLSVVVPRLTGEQGLRATLPVRAPITLPQGQSIPADQALRPPAP